MKKLQIKTIAILCMLSLVLGIGFVPAKQVQAATPKNELVLAGGQAATPKYKKAYNRIIKNEKLIEKYQDVNYLKGYFGSDYGWDKYYYYDLDKNGIPELFIYSKTMGLTQVFTYKKKLISLGYYYIARINKAKKEIIVHGHWHGAGGSGDKEWTIYSMSKNGKSMKTRYYIDILGGTVSVYNGNWKLISSSRSTYYSIYNKHVKPAKKQKKFKMQYL